MKNQNKDLMKLVQEKKDTNTTPDRKAEIEFEILEILLNASKEGRKEEARKQAIAERRKNERWKKKR